MTRCAVRSNDAGVATSKHDDDAHGHAHRPPSSFELPPKRVLERASSFFRAAGDYERLRIMGLLLQREWCVTEIAEALDEALPTVSQRLRILRGDGLVRRRREGKHIYYALADTHVSQLLASALEHADEPVGEEDE